MQRLQDLHLRLVLPEAAVGPVQEETEKLAAEGASGDIVWTDPDEHQLLLRDRATRRAIARTTPNIGDALSRAAAAPEWRNPGIEVFLADAGCKDERKVSDARNFDAVRPRLVRHFPSFRCATIVSPSPTCSAHPHRAHGRRGDDEAIPHGLGQ